MWTHCHFYHLLATDNCMRGLRMCNLYKHPAEYSLC
uniref:Uncharacterized protein n=1 Tax=Rhizophora mucronata TaxID=61149 RepID=A0A2P2JPD4_RHIMU